MPTHFAWQHTIQQSHSHVRQQQYVLVQGYNYHRLCRIIHVQRGSWRWRCWRKWKRKELAFWAASPQMSSKERGLACSYSRSSHLSDVCLTSYLGQSRSWQNHGALLSADVWKVASDFGFNEDLSDAHAGTTPATARSAMQSVNLFMIVVKCHFHGCMMTRAEIEGIGHANSQDLDAA